MLPMMAKWARWMALHSGLVADEVDFSNCRIGLQRQPDPIDDDSAAVVATHDIDYDSHKSEERRSTHDSTTTESQPPLSSPTLDLSTTESPEELTKRIA